MGEQSSEEPSKTDESSEKSPEVMLTLDDIVPKSSLEEFDKRTLEARAVQGQDLSCPSQEEVTDMMLDKEILPGHDSMP